MRVAGWVLCLCWATGAAGQPVSERAQAQQAAYREGEVVLAARQCAAAALAFRRALAVKGSERVIQDVRRNASILLGKSAVCHVEAGEGEAACAVAGHYEEAYGSHVEGRHLTQAEAAQVALHQKVLRSACDRQPVAPTCKATPAVCPPSLAGAAPAGHDLEWAVTGAAGGLLVAGATAFAMGALVEAPNGRDSDRDGYLRGGTEHLDQAGLWLAGTGALTGLVAGALWWLAFDGELP